MSRAATARVLLVEGTDDREVIYQFCNARGIDNRALFTTRACDGYEDLRKQISPRVKAPGAETVGLLVDADADPTTRWQSLADAIRPLGYEPPIDPPAEGLILEGARRRPRVGIWMMPDNRAPGMIEDFLRTLATDARLFERAEAAVEAIPKDERRVKASYRSKAVLHTWLAWQQEPGKHAGQALKLRYLDPDHALGPPFARWLIELFDRGVADL